MVKKMSENTEKTLKDYNRETPFYDYSAWAENKEEKKDDSRKN